MIVTKPQVRESEDEVAMRVTQCTIKLGKEMQAPRTGLCLGHLWAWLYCGGSTARDDLPLPLHAITYSCWGWRREQVLDPRSPGHQV